MKIVLVNPPNEWDLPTKEVLYPFSLLYLTNYLYKKEKIPSEIIDCDGLELTQEEYRYRLKDANPDVIGFTGHTRNRFLVCDEIKYARKMFPKAKIVTGGRHFAPTAADAIVNLPQLDVVVRGDGEITFYELIKAWQKGLSLKKIEGISFRKDGEIIHNPERKPYSNIEEFDIDEEYLDSIEGNYSPTQKLGHFPEIDAIPILVGRGCPNKCTFCQHASDTYRVRSLKSIIEEVENKKKRYGVSAFNFIDPALTIRKKFVKELCNEIIERNLGIIWYCESRVDTDLDLLPLMKKAGCVSLDFALESGSDKVLKAIQKNISLEQVLTFAQKVHSLGIRSLVFTMISLPEEQIEDAQQTLDMIKKLAPYIYKTANMVLRILPGTQIEQQAIQKGILPKNFSWYDPSFTDPYADYLGVQYLPVWIEHLSPQYIITWSQEYFKIVHKHFTSYGELARLIKRDFKKTFFDWKNEGLDIKARRGLKLFRIFYNKLNRST